MASLVRMCRVSRNIMSNLCRQRSRTEHVRHISSTDKNKDSIAASPKFEKAEEKDDVDPNWISFGFDLTDPIDDRVARNMFWLISFSLCIIGSGFVIAYFPDPKLRDWSLREAYLELDRRERNGLPLVDPNLIDPETIPLPSDEELGDFEIIV